MEASTVPAVEESTGSKTIADMMALAAERHGDRAAVKYKRDGAWHDVSFAEVGEIVSEIARGLIDLGLAPGDRVALLCATRPEWTYADFAITSAGGVVVPIYPTNSPSECAWVAGNSESRFIVCENADQVAKITQVRADLPALEAVIVDRRERRRRRRDRARGPARARPRPRRRRGGRARRRGQALRPVHVHLHVGHHRAAEGLRAHARQLPRGAQLLRVDRRARVGRGRLPLPPARALLRAADPAAGDRPRLHDRLLRRRREADRRRAQRGPPDLPAVGAADLREDLHPRHRQRRPRADQGRHPGRAEGAAAAGRRPGGPGRAAGRTSTRPTRRCSRTSARRSAATSSRPTPAPRRSPRRSSSSSTPAACRCSRATG